MIRARVQVKVAKSILKAVADGHDVDSIENGIWAALREKRPWLTSTDISIEWSVKLCEEKELDDLYSEWKDKRKAKGKVSSSTDTNTPQTGRAKRGKRGGKGGAPPPRAKKARIRRLRTQKHKTKQHNTSTVLCFPRRSAGTCRSIKSGAQIKSLLLDTRRENVNNPHYHRENCTRPME